MPFLVILVVAVAAASVWLGSLARKKRRQELGALADRLGWTFDPDSDVTLDDQYLQFGCFSRGHSRAGYNTLRGGRQIAGKTFEVQAGDYTYKVTSSDGKTTSTQTYRFSYAIIRVPWLGVPDLLVRREGILDKVKSAMGFDDIDFESEEFSRKFWVTCPDKKFAYDVIHPRMMEFLLAGDPGPVELRDGCVCITDGMRVWPTQGFEPRLAWTERFFALWPEHLTSTLEARA